MQIQNNIDELKQQLTSHFSEEYLHDLADSALAEISKDSSLANSALDEQIGVWLKIISKKINWDLSEMIPSE